jgi:hypothetical protein
MEATQRLRAGNYTPVRLGEFTLDPKLPPAQDLGMSMRGANTVSSPIEGSFTQYLKATLAEELKAAGLLNPASDVLITGSLVATDLQANIGTGTGLLKARFVVTRNGVARYDREVQVEDSWDSSFIGGVAIPAAANHYQGLFRKMVLTLTADKDFLAAISK